MTPAPDEKLLQAFDNAINKDGQFETVDGVIYPLFSAKQVRQIRELLKPKPTNCAGLVEAIMLIDKIANDSGGPDQYKMNRIWHITQQALEAHRAEQEKGLNDG